MALMLVLVVVSGVTAFLARSAKSTNGNSTTHIAPASLNANSPSKEYIYAGGRLIATEEPVTTSLNAPANLRATTASATQIQVTWSTVSGAARYEIQRSANYNNPTDNGFSTVTTNGTSPYPDSATTGNAYVYRVRAFDQFNNASPFSNIDLATAIGFSEDPVSNGMTVKEVHITQLRQAVDAVRIASGLPAATWTDPPPLAQIVTIKKIHIEQLRSNLDDARLALTLPAPTYIDPTITQFVTTVKAANVQQLRQLVKGYRTVTG
ncbi:MAG TPA: hypothetical protein VFV34_00050 [Blastocatellia bacterium]|nr:hypothetical protein [Blastocatellia bacterium]